MRHWNNSLCGNMYIPTPKKGELLVCPVCKKQFKASDDTKYICMGGYTCGWGCFMDKVKNPDKYKKGEEAPTPQPSTTLVDKPIEMKYNKGTKTKVDLFSVEEPTKSSGRKKKSS